MTAARVRELEANPRAAAVVHWDTLGRQVRLEGAVSVSPPEESDAYFGSRPLDSRIGAWASLQSQPLDERATLLSRVAAESARLGTDVPRPRAGRITIVAGSGRALD
jgi:pyridoxamine 5'-phosphate oxidase